MPRRKPAVPAISNEIKKIADALMAITLEHVGKYFNANPKSALPEGTSRLNAKQKEVIKVINSEGFGCWRPSVIKLASVLVEKDITPFTLDEHNLAEEDTSCIDTDDLKLGVLLVPIKDETETGFEVGKPYMITEGESDTAWIQDNNERNGETSIDLDVECLRLPTVEEAQVFVAANLPFIKRKFLVI